MALEIEYRAETEDDIADLAEALLKVRAISHMGEHFLNKHITEEFYELSEAFKTIRLLIEPALTFFTDDGVWLIQGRGGDDEEKTEAGAPHHIGNRSDALALLDGMISRIERSNAGAAPQLRGKENAIGGDAYYWPRLEALRDAIGRKLI